MYREITDWARNTDPVRVVLQLERTAFPAGFARCQRCHILRPRNGVETLPTPLGSPETHAENPRHCSIQTRVPSLPFTARHTGLTTGKLAVESRPVTPRNWRVSPVTKAMATNHCTVLSVQRASSPRCAPAVRSLRARPRTGVQANTRPLLDGRDCLFGHRASIRPTVPPRAWYREPVLTAAVYNLEQALKTAIPTQSLDSTKQPKQKATIEDVTATDVPTRLRRR